MENERENSINEETKKQYQISRAEEYLKEHMTNGDFEPSLATCIISDLLGIIKENNK